MRPEDRDKNPEILRNDPDDPTVVIDEGDRTVILTEDETVVMEQAPPVDLVPPNRPRKVYAGMWGKSEVITVALAMLALFTVIVVHLFVVLPASRDLDSKTEVSVRLERDLISTREKYGSMESSETEAAKLLVSVNDFEARVLRREELGKTALYERLNSLMRAYNLVNASGPDYSPLKPPAEQRQAVTEEERGRDRFASLFPGVFVTVTLEGSYQNLRRFISALENSNEFITIASVELVPAERQSADSEDANANESSKRPGKTRGEIVSLKLEMASYFRRPGFVPVEIGGSE